MDDTPYREFFARPTHPYHRRYEALRAVFLDGRSQKDVAEHFGYRYSTLRQLIYEFRRQAPGPGDAAPFFGSRRAADRPHRASRRHRG
jgi:transposase